MFWVICAGQVDQKYPQINTLHWRELAAYVCTTMNERVCWDSYNEKSIKESVRHPQFSIVIVNVPRVKCISGCSNTKALLYVGIKWCIDLGWSMHWGEMLPEGHSPNPAEVNGKIHIDFEGRWIRQEFLLWDSLVQRGKWAKCDLWAQGIPQSLCTTYYRQPSSHWIRVYV